MPRLMSVSERFWTKVDRRRPDDCWLWAGSLNSSGYGWFKLAGHATGAHRVSYELANGSIPAQMHVCHRCDNPPCVNPAHLFLGTVQDNVTDKVAKGRHPNSLQQACKNGHPFDAANTYVNPRGHRQCRACNRAAQMRYSRRKVKA